MLRGHRRAARLTLEQLAEASGVSARALSDMERGRSRGPQHRTVTALADALRLDDTARGQLVDLAREGRLRDHWTRPSGLCELPRSVDDFTGRVAELAWTDELVRADSLPGAAGVALVSGAAGLGKTTLAVRAAHAVRAHFTDGVFFLDLLGMSQHPVAVDDALRLLLGALGILDQQLPGDTPGRASLYRSLLRDRRALVVLDNAASEEQVRPLLPGGGAGSRALVTSRRLLPGLEGVRRLGLGPLPVLEATGLLTGILGERSAADGEPALTQLAQLCGGLPLALRIVGNRLVSRPGWSAAELAARMTDEERRLSQLKAGDLEIATAFGMSYDQLPDTARRVFRRLALVPGPDFDAALAAVLGDTSIEDAWGALDELVDLGLLQDGPSGRSRFHDLVRLFARDRLHREDTEADRGAATDRMMSWLLRTATTAGRWFESSHGRPDRPAAGLPGLSSVEEAGRWLQADADNWLEALRHAAGSGQHETVLDCAESLRWFGGWWNAWPHWQEVFSLGAQAAARGDRAYQAAQLTYLARVFHAVPPADPEVTMRYAAEVLRAAVDTGVPEQIAWGHRYVGGALLRLGRLDEAVASVAEAARMFKSDGDVDAYCQCLGTIGECLRSAGHHAEALERYREMWELAADGGSGMTPSIAAVTRPNALAAGGVCLRLLGRPDEAIATFTEAIGLFEQLPMSGSQARCLEALAATLAQQGRADESRQVYTRATETFEAVGDTAAALRCRDLAAPTP
ncbi:tetratricopeptide repeat protein [Dactylosporangium sp. AC04546]|uniref:XRE family transcriptional regulator n=1 Tax=Dactylosporangium sp. AC04546 TaxID=2862460 RepID=UPI001EDD0561|nr:XRE family transcriptional regulator [Dactylosporangium sp. AC04546]WVK79622.1 tetratricopeptide repeat protein [Dactylosporangium sp. AC04546]